jgi:hypothetical protein
MALANRSLHMLNRVNGKSIDHVASDIKFTLMSVEVMAKHLLAK